MSIESFKLALSHSRLLFWRKLHQSFFQIALSVFLTFASLEMLYLISIDSQNRSILSVYFLIVLAINTIMSMVLFYREARIEKNTFQYLILSGRSKVLVFLSVFIKWVYILILGFLSGLILFLGFNFNWQSIFIDRGFLFTNTPTVFGINMSLSLTILLSLLKPSQSKLSADV